ncbi:hypothetical protein [Methanohalobium evestigatum]|uniref:hypothetical protein n=1 Tax=Methanohalobium evestigatum TaxID=2322 RepID=UPI00067832F6|nr:hypothetical protein [Methanohalobium evestigatum]
MILIIDGLGSSYIYPEMTPEKIDGVEIRKPVLKNFSFIFNKSARVLNISAPHPYTEAGHSIIVTGYSDATSKTVGFSGCTIFDVAKDNGFKPFAVM